MRIERASSIIEGFQKAIEIIDGWSEPDEPAYCWFRGVNDNGLDLRPSAVWRQAASGYKEFEALVSFVQDGVAFAPVGAIDSWDTYYMAQHHAVPTRLLDWTESFCAAMFFALDGLEDGKTPCVWILRPELLNHHFMNWKGILAPENYPEMDRWLPRQISKHLQETSSDGCVYDNHRPVAVLAKKSNRRIIAQQGSFTLHGRDPRPLCQMIADEFADADKVLARIDFVGIDVKKARLHLDRLGVKRSAIYPDIDNFVKQLGEYYWPAPSK